MDLSVIVPCHNSENCIQPLLWALNNQVLDGYEVECIFVLDACDDNTSGMINERLDKSKYSCSIIETNFKHPGGARNAGFKISRGRYIWFIDSDDWIIDIRAFSDLIRTMDRNPEFKVIRIKYISNMYDFYPLKDIQTYYWMMVWQYFFKRETIEDLIFKESDWDEDIYFMQEVGKKVDFTQFVTRKSYYYYNYSRPGSRMFTRYGDVTKLDYKGVGDN